MNPSYSRNYIKEFLRILAPRGVLIFQLPDGGKAFNDSGTLNIRGLILRLVPKFVLDMTYRKVKSGDRRPRMEMYWIRRKEVIRFLRKNGGTVVDVNHDQSVESQWMSFRYCVTKR